MAEVKCSICDFYAKKEDIKIHLCDEHNISLEYVDIELSSIEEFEKFKAELENETNTHFIKDCGGSKKNKEGIQRFYFVCNLSKQRIHDTENETRKVYLYCPSSIKLTVSSEGICKVHFCKTHLGHNKEDIKSLECPLCDFAGPKTNFEAHFSSIHDIKLEYDDLLFSCLEEFETWKINVEKETKEMFIKDCGVKKTSSGTEYHYFSCHRSGHFATKSLGKRHIKLQGSKKINSYCPAKIKATKMVDGQCKVSFLKTHIGHESELQHMFLSKTEKQLIATKIALNIPFNTILSEIRNTLSDCNLDRVHLATRQDLLNIEKRFNLTHTKHKDDGTSINAWVSEMRINGNIVLYYKPQGTVDPQHVELKNEDFALMIMTEAQSEILKKYASDCVCVDGTHGLNAYKFELVTVLVLDDIHQGFPCAFLISNRIDETCLSIFFKYIKDKIGVIQSNVFMSDMAHSFYNAWCQVMEVPKKRLFCTWHVDHAWRNNLKKIKSTEKQLEIYKMLRTLLEERDSTAFQKMLTKAIATMLNNADTSEFGKYFQTTYANCVEAWAYCHRLHCGINTNMHLESMHRTIKHVYLQGKQIKRLDKSINILMQFIKDKSFDRLIIMYKGKITNKLIQLRKRHTLSLKLSNELVSKNENGGWNVISSSEIQEVYFVQESCMECKCKLTCLECKSCIHNYTCTCIDSCIKWNMCKHIHLICRVKLMGTENSSEEVVLQNDDEPTLHMHVPNENKELDSLLLEVSKNDSLVSNFANLSHKREKLKQKMLRIIDSISSKRQLEAFERLISPIEPTLNAIASTSSSITSQNILQKVPANKNIAHQRPLYSTRKTGKKPKRSIVKPNPIEQQKIALSLILDKNSNSNDLGNEI